MKGAERVALLEIGTNTTKLLIADVLEDQFRILLLESETTRIGRGLEGSGRIPREALANNMAAIERLKRAIHARGCDRVFAFSTFALRKASNSGPVCRRLERAIGGPLRILSGPDEARFAYLSARRNLRLERPLTVLIDTGGGSTELVIASRGRVILTRSLALGALHLTERFIHQDPIDALEFTRLSTHVHRAVRRALQQPGMKSVAPRDIDLVSSGGTIGAISHVIAGKRRGSRRGEMGLPPRIRLAEAESFLDLCLSLPLRERKRIPGLQPERADIIVAGLVIVVSFMRALGKRVLRPNRGGVREGVLIHLIRNGYRW